MDFYPARRNHCGLFILGIHVFFYPGLHEHAQHLKKHRNHEQ